jgi:hypothetical protein
MRGALSFKGMVKYKINVNVHVVSRPEFPALSNGALAFPASTFLTPENGS